MVKGSKNTPETLEKMRLAHTGVKRSLETRKKISEKSKGKNNGMWGKTMSLENRRKMSVRLMGKPKTKNHRNNISRGLKGRVFSEAHRNRISESAKKRTGAKNPSWKGGISFAKYSVDWTETLKRSIRERDNYTCRVCGKQQGEISHDVHHIDYVKTNCDPKNLITLCKNCHCKTTGNRERWKEYFNLLK